MTFTAPARSASALMAAAAVGLPAHDLHAASHRHPHAPPNLRWYGGPVQRHPRVFIIFWGPKWSTDARHRAARAVVIRTIRALRDSSYERLLTQYYDRGGHITGDVRLAGRWHDRTIPRGDYTAGSRGVHRAAEAVAHAIAVNRWRNSEDAQYLLLVQSPEPNGYCGDNVNRSLHGQLLIFTIIPWLGRIAAGCGGGSGGSPAEAYESTVSHEYAEMVTDPLANAWARGDPAGHNYEIADLCNANARVHGVWMQKLWSNRAHRCEA